MEEYINISLDCSPFLSKILDLRVPVELTVKELIQIVLGIQSKCKKSAVWGYTC